MIKYASNAFLAARVSFINEIANICEALGADVKDVAVGWVTTNGSAPIFSMPGSALAAVASPKTWRPGPHGRRPWLPSPAPAGRDGHQPRPAPASPVQGAGAAGHVGRKGDRHPGLAFKPNTDDMREAPSIEIVHLLQSEGAQVRAYDPVAMANAGRYLHDVTLCRDAYEAADGADALIVVTEWNEFKHLSLSRLKTGHAPADRRRRPQYLRPQGDGGAGLCLPGRGRGYAI